MNSATILVVDDGKKKSCRKGGGKRGKRRGRGGGKKRRKGGEEKSRLTFPSRISTVQSSSAFRLAWPSLGFGRSHHLLSVRTAGEEEKRGERERKKKGKEGEKKNEFMICFPPPVLHSRSPGSLAGQARDDPDAGTWKSFDAKTERRRQGKKKGEGKKEKKEGKGVS